MNNFTLNVIIILCLFSSLIKAMNVPSLKTIAANRFMDKMLNSPNPLESIKEDELPIEIQEFIIMQYFKKNFKNLFALIDKNPALSYKISEISSYDRITKVAINKDNTLLAASSSNGYLAIIDLLSLKVKHELKSHTTDNFMKESVIHDVTFSPDNKRIYALSREDVHIWDAKKGDLLGSFKVPKFYDSRRQRQTINKDGTRLLISNSDESHVYDAIDYKLVYSLPIGRAKICGDFIIGFNPDFLRNSEDKIGEYLDVDFPSLHIYELNGTLKHKLDFPDFPLASLYIKANEEFLVVNISDRIGKITQIYDIRSGKLLHSIMHDSELDFCKSLISKDGNFIVTFCDDFCYTWSTQRGNLLNKFYLPCQGRCTKINNEGRLLIIACRDEEDREMYLIRLVDLFTGKIIYQFETRNDKFLVTSLAMSLNDSTIATGNALDNTIYVYDTPYALLKNLNLKQFIAMLILQNYKSNNADDLAIKNEAYQLLNRKSTNPLLEKLLSTKFVKYSDCDICQEFLGEENVKLDCGHNKFHVHCLEQWKEYDSSCPVCRREIK